MALFALTMVASDGSQSSGTTYLNPEFVSSVGTPTASELVSFPTAQSFVTYRSLEQQTMKVRRILSSSTPAAVNSAISAAANGVLGGGVSGNATLVAGTVAVNIPGLTTSNVALLTRKTVGGTVTSTVEYQYAVTANTLTITAAVAAGTINTADTSVISFAIVG